jgi:DNA-binding transcriptional LysR family regulator
VIGRLPDSSLITRKLGDVTNRLYAAPAYLAARGAVRTIADLAGHEAVLLRALAGETRWELVGPRGVERVDVTGRIVADHMQIVVDAAIAGAGIALLPTHLGDRAVERGELVAILPRYGIETTLHMLAHAGRHLPRRVALLRDYLADIMSGHCKAHGKQC